MKKLLLFFWNGFFIIKDKIKDSVHIICDKIYSAFNKAPQIMTNEETVDYILKNNCCVSRFGDGEIKLLRGIDLPFQKSDDRITSAYKKILSQKKDNLLVCLPSVFEKAQREIFTDDVRKHWVRHLAYFRKSWYENLHFNRTYGNAFISRSYLSLKDKSDAGEYFSLVKKIWQGRDIIIVEGEKSRLGMGNDLFDNAKSVRRILAPSAQAFSKYDELLKEVKTHGKEPLYILALGPTATIMAYDLCVEGFTAIDLGNIDTEYEWFKMGATQKVPVKNKMVYEAGAGKGVGDADDPQYLSEIIAKIL